MKIVEKVMFVLKKEKKVLFLQPQTKGELSSVGSEHRPYKAGVVGSSPTVPTKRKRRPWLPLFSMF